MKKNTKLILWISILFISIGINAQNTELQYLVET